MIARIVNTLCLIQRRCSKNEVLCFNKNFQSTVKKLNDQEFNYELSLMDENLNLSTKLKIEEYWKDKLKHPQFDTSNEEAKFYVLSMFPYPSGNLHMGHIRVYSISDTLARFHRMNGKNVLHPIGWDAFGLPAENAAIERGLSSEKWTADNISTMREQLQQLGCTFDWSREVTTCHPEYYQFTQLIFLKMFECGLVYQKKALVNWDPLDKTVLADEQVDENGCSWRSGAKVEKKILKQWFIRTTAFAKKLYDGLNHKDLEDWRDIIELQKGWIGECNGVSFELPLIGKEEELTVWIENPEHLPKAKFIAVKPGSVVDLEDGGSGARKLKICALNTLSEQPLPIYVTDELPINQSSDARIGIPEVNECDRKFSLKVGLSVSEKSEICDTIMELYKGNIQRIIDKIKGRITSSNLKDWLISRQRHWGTPIPMVHCGQCGAQPVSEDQLPVRLPLLERVSEKGAQMAYPAEWMSTICPKCKGPATRDTDTMDTFVDSSWYFLRYLDPHNKEEAFCKSVAAGMMPVDIYIGGKEHAYLHLYYARFVSYFLHSMGWLPEPEPFKRLVVQGMILGRTYQLQSSGQYLPASQVDLTGEAPVEKGTGRAVRVTWDKMSKSRYNGVDPAEMFREYGVDTTRLLVLASTAPTSPRNWDQSMFPGVLNWQHKLWLTVQQFRQARLRADLPPPADLADIDKFLQNCRNFRLMGITIAYRVTHLFNSVIAEMQGLTSELRRYGDAHMAHSEQFERGLVTLVVALAPLAPHFSAQLWGGLQALGPRLSCRDFDWDSPAHLQAWPQIDPDYELILSCKVNGAVKDSLKVSRVELDALTETSATQLALASQQVREYTDQSPVLAARLWLFPGLHAILDLEVDHHKLRFDKEHFKKKKQERKRKRVSV